MLNRLGRLAALALGVTLLAACASSGEGRTEGREVSALVFIGDSNLDIGRAMTERDGVNNDGRVVPPNTVGKRYSNGPILPEFLAERLKLDQQNFAWGGATSGRLNIAGTSAAPDMRETGALAQMDEFEAALGGKPANPAALYMVMAGSNDLASVNKADQPAIDKAIAGAIANLRTIITRLDAAGAEFIVVGTRTPRPVLSGRDRAADEPDAEAKNDAAGRQLNIAIGQLADQLDRELDADVEVFDVYAEIRDIIARAPEFGLAAYSPAPEAYCTAQADCSRLINHDNAHKTSAVHAILADRFIAQFGLRPADR